MFAVQSVAFLRGYNDYYPFTRRFDRYFNVKNTLIVVNFFVLKRQFLIFIFSDLKKHDLKSFKLLKKMWNMEPVIEVDREAFRDGDLPS